MSRYALVFDPSGNFDEGLGTTGWCLADIETKKICKFGVIQAKDFKNKYDYWDAHVDLIDGMTGFHPDIVIEDYLLYSNRADSQINSRLETPQLIGILKYEAYKRGLYICIQTAMQVKTRWPNELLIKKGYLTARGKKVCIGDVPVVNHIQDSVRHAVHYMTYNSSYKKE